MDLKVVRGRTIELPAEFYSGDDPTDPLTPRIDIVGPTGEVVVANGVPARRRKGVYFFNFPVPTGAPTGTWKAVWSARIDGSQVSAADLFEVAPAAVAAGPAAAAPPVAPPSSPAAPKPAPPGLTAAPKQPATPPGAVPAKPAAAPAAAAPKPAASKPAPETLEAKTIASEKAAAPRSGDSGSSKEGGGGVGKRARKRAAAAAAVPVTAALEAEDEPAKPATRGKFGSTEAGPRSRLSMGKALLILAALGVVIASIWFSPRRGDSIQAKIDEGVAAQKAGRVDEAQRLYEEVLSNDPDNKLANFNLGVAAQVAGDMERAENLYEKSLDADPKFLPALFNLAILLERTDRNEESAETYRRLLENYPNNGPAHLNYGFLLADKLGKPDEGREEFKKAVENDPTLARRIPEDMRPAPAAP